MEQLIAQGVVGSLETLEPTHSPIIWTSIATGKTPDEHGIEGFVYRDEGKVRPYTSRQRRVKAFWNILSDRGLTVHTVGWWTTYPAEKVQGTLVSQVNTVAVAERRDRGLWKGGLVPGLPQQVHPPDEQPQVMEMLDRVDAELDARLTSLLGPCADGLGPLEARLWEQIDESDRFELIDSAQVL